MAELAHNFLLKQAPISRLSEEYGQIEYSLQLALRSTVARITGVWAVGNPHLNLQFEKRTRGSLVLDSWINVVDLEDSNSIDEVFQRGFKVPPTGLKFPSGAIHLDEYALRRAASNGKQHEFLLCKIGVGRAYCVDEAAYNPSHPVRIPDGYDSLYLNSNTDDDADATAADRQDYRHDYILDDGHQVLPVCLVHFEYDPEEDQRRAVPVCEICAETPAVVYCHQDEARLCDECDEETHSGNKVVMRHRRVPIREAPQTYGSCPQHSSLIVEFYCPTCQVPVCVHCKMVGTHSAGEAASHKLVGIADAYRDAIAQAGRIDPVLEKKKEAVQRQLEAIDDRIQDVNRNSHEVSERIFEIIKRAQDQLEEATSQKLAVLLGDSLELSRQRQEIEWAESFLAHQRDILSPVEFLTSWHRHLATRRDLHSFEHLRSHIDVAADLDVRGAVHVGTHHDLADAAMEAHEVSLHQHSHAHVVKAGGAGVGMMSHSFSDVSRRTASKPQFRTLFSGTQLKSPNASLAAISMGRLPGAGSGTAAGSGSHAHGGTGKDRRESTDMLRTVLSNYADEEEAEHAQHSQQHQRSDASPASAQGGLGRGGAGDSPVAGQKDLWNETLRGAKSNKELHSGGA